MISSIKSKLEMEILFCYFDSFQKFISLIFDKKQICKYCQREFKCQVSHLQMDFFATLSFTIIDEIASGLKCTAVQAPFLIFWCIAQCPISADDFSRAKILLTENPIISASDFVSTKCNCGSFHLYLSELAFINQF